MISTFKTICSSQNSKIPVVINNRGGRVVKGDMMVITKEMLQVSSVDPANVRSGDVIYTLVPSAGNPKQGEYKHRIIPDIDRYYHQIYSYQPRW